MADPKCCVGMGGGWGGVLLGIHNDTEKAASSDGLKNLPSSSCSPAPDEKCNYSVITRLTWKQTCFYCVKQSHFFLNSKTVPLESISFSCLAILKAESWIYFFFFLNVLFFFSFSNKLGSTREGEGWLLPPFTPPPPKQNVVETLFFFFF